MPWSWNWSKRAQFWESPQRICRTSCNSKFCVQPAVTASTGSTIDFFWRRRLLCIWRNRSVHRPRCSPSSHGRFPASRTRIWRNFDTSPCGPCPREAESQSRFVFPSENSQKNSASNFLGPPCIRTCRGEESGQDGSVSSHAVWRRRHKSCLEWRSPKSRRRFGASEQRRSDCRRLRLGRRGKQPKGVIDTSVLVAGVAGFKSLRAVENPSASLLWHWLENETTWLVTEDILSEYKEVLSRLGVRRNLVGGIINLLREAAEFVGVRSENDVSPDPTDNAFCACAEQGHAAFIATLNRKDFPQKKLVAKVISPGDPIPTTRRRRSPLGGWARWPCRLVNVAFEERGLYRGGPASKHKAGNLEVQNWGVSRYLVYLNNRAAGKGSVKTIDLCDQKTAPLTPKSFIYNRHSYSQAGRRGFESRLPLHFQQLTETTILLHPPLRTEVTFSPPWGASNSLILLAGRCDVQREAILQLLFLPSSWKCGRCSSALSAPSEQKQCTGKEISPELRFRVPTNLKLLLLDGISRKL